MIDLHALIFLKILNNPFTNGYCLYAFTRTVNYTEGVGSPKWSTDEGITGTGF